MSYKILENTIKTVVSFLENKNLDYALIGGLAVSFRASERATKDIDLVVAVGSDSEAENTIRLFVELGFLVDTLIERKNSKEIATVRLLSDKHSGVFLDLLFNATGIEKEIVESSDSINILPKLSVNVASLASLIAMKVLSSNNKDRLQDIIDLQHLIKEADCEDLIEAEKLIYLIHERGYDSEQDLKAKFIEYKKQFLGATT